MRVAYLLDFEWLGFGLMSAAGVTSSCAIFPASRNPSCAVNSWVAGFTLVTSTDTAMRS